MNSTEDEPILPPGALLAALWQLRRFIGPHRRGLYVGIAAFDAPVTLSFIFDLSSPLAKIRTPSRFLRTMTGGY